MGLISNIFLFNPPPSASSLFLILSYVQSSKKNSSLYQFVSLLLFCLFWITVTTEEQRDCNYCEPGIKCKRYYWRKKKRDKVRKENNKGVLVSSGGSSFRTPAGLLWFRFCGRYSKEVLCTCKNNSYTLNVNDLSFGSRRKNELQAPFFHFFTTLYTGKKAHFKIGKACRAFCDDYFWGKHLWEPIPPSCFQISP